MEDDNKGALPVASDELLKATPVVGNIKELFLDDTIEEEMVLILDIKGTKKKMVIKYHEILWPLYNDIVETAFRETSEMPDYFERVKQEKLMKAMVTKIADTSVGEKSEFWLKIPGSLGENMRRLFFRNTGEFRINEAMVKNLRKGLEKETESG